MSSRNSSLADQLAQERLARRASEDLLDQSRRALAQAQKRVAELEAMHPTAPADPPHSSLKRLWNLFDTLPDGLALYDEDLRLIAANHVYFEVFSGEIALPDGVRYDDFLALAAHHGLLADTAQDLADGHHQMLARLRTEPVTPLMLHLPDGRQIKLDDQWTKDGALISRTQDLTLQLKREQELDAARVKAEHASRLKSVFVANMSHEIRTPMNGVVGMAELLAETELNTEQKLFADTIRTSGEALLTIINDVLDYSKIEAERLQLYPESFDLERCIRDVVILLQPAAREKNIRLLVDYDLFLPTHFIADPVRIRQILTNLVGNAVKFTQTGHVLVRVAGVEKTDTTFDLHISVEDTGIGIHPDFLADMFGKFNQGNEESTRRLQGTGLGLAITRQLVELMGGTIWVESEYGRGSCFEFKLGLHSAQAPDAATTDQPPVELNAVLVVDDLEINRTILERQMSGFGLGVETCASATQALEHFENGATCDVLVVDAQMPEMGGLALCASLRAKGMTMPAVLLSSDHDQPPPAELAHLDLHYLQKPVRRVDLLRTLQTLCTSPDTARLPTTDSLRKMRVLAAEDNCTNQLVLRKMVQSLDLDLHFAANGREAVEKWQTFRPDLIFMDISMPDMDGKQASRAIRQAEANGAHVPICALTAHAMCEDKAIILAAGMDDYLSKPLRKADLIAAITRHCPAHVRSPLPEDPLRPAVNAP
ncbi:response regulator [Rhodobacteraceae bacterium]|nr:response regulator [Paracoccaceae bacterium]